MRRKKNHKRRDKIVESLVFVAILFGFSYVKDFRKSSIVEDTIYTQIKGMKDLKQLDLVTYYFESSLNTENPSWSDQQNQHIVIPTTVNGYLDMDQMRYRITDTLITIYLSEPKIDAHIPESDSIRITSIENNEILDSMKILSITSSRIP